MVRLMATLALALVVVASPALATYRNNLVYLSPSGRHPVLGISLGKVQARTAASSPWDPAKLNFTHGVASGDPWDDSVILWTRVAPIGADNDATNVTVEGLVDLYSHDSETWVKSSSAPVCVEWAISASKTLEKGNVVDSGEAWTSSDVDWTVKVCRHSCLGSTHVRKGSNKLNLDRWKRRSSSPSRLTVRLEPKRATCGTPD